MDVVHPETGFSELNCVFELPWKSLDIQVESHPACHKEYCLKGKKSYVFNAVTEME